MKRLGWMAASSTLLLMMGTSCMDNFLPEEKDAFDRDVNFTTTIFTQIGRAHV